MEEYKHRQGLQLLLYVLFSGVMFWLPYNLIAWWGIETVNWMWYLILGNISTIGFAIIAGITERVTRIEKEVFDRHQDR